MLIIIPVFFLLSIFCGNFTIKNARLLGLTLRKIVSTLSQPINEQLILIYLVTRVYVAQYIQQNVHLNYNNVKVQRINNNKTWLATLKFNCKLCNSSINENECKLYFRSEIPLAL